MQIFKPVFFHQTSVVTFLLAAVMLGEPLSLPAAISENDNRPHQSRPPNIVLVFADDLGWKDVGYQGSDFYETPNLDRLAAQGMVFSSAYASAGNCAPSRACMLSGTYTPRHQLYAVGSTERGPKKNMRLVPIPSLGGIPPETVTMADTLKAAGYATGIFGKWHLKGEGGSLPSQQGFDVNYDSFGEGQLPEGGGGNKPGPPHDPKGIYTLTDQACLFIEKNQAGPFFVFLSHHAIHTPLQASDETKQRFQQKTPGDNHRNVLYASCTYDFDDSVGRLMDKLDQLQLTDNTLLVFTSDNGATNQSPQEPLRGNKGGYYEGGIRVPMIVRWPAVVSAGTSTDVPVNNVDFYPLFADVAGAQIQANVTLDGVSLLPLLNGESLGRSAIYWHFPGYLNNPVIRGRKIDVQGNFRSRPVTVMRKGTWKLHLFHEEWSLDGGRQQIPQNNAVELYNLAEDIGERQDLSRSHAKQRDEMLNEMLRWIETVDAKIPSEPHPAYEQVQR